MKWGWKREENGRVFYLFDKAIYRKKRQYKIDDVMKELRDIKTIHLPAAIAHPSVFSKYKNSLRGKDVALVATGPTLDLYTPLPGVLHMGVNRSYQSHVPLDYHMALGYQFVPDEDLLNYRDGLCTKFYGYSYEPYPSMKARMDDAKCIERFYFTMHSCSSPDSIPQNIEHAPLMVMESVVTAAMQLLLWMHPRRIYLVGCDSNSSGYFKNETSSVPQFLGPKRICIAWKRIKDFAEDLYPDVEIISINPKGLTGLFRDVYMEDGKFLDSVGNKL